MSIQVVLYKDNQTFYPGGLLEGKVVCVINSRKNIKGIELKLRGREHTSWTEWENRYNSLTKKTERESIHYSGNNKFLLVQINLQGEGTIEAGIYEYPFRFSLPFNIPSTYQGTHGYIKYYLKANVDIPFAFDYKDERIFNVLSPIDFNRMLDQIVLNPIQYQEESNRCCCCCNVGPITLEVYLPKKAFILGEKITMRVYINNMSNDTITRLSVKVKRIVKEKCTLPRKDEKTIRKTLLERSDTGVGAHGNRNYDMELQIPPSLDLPNFEISRLFAIWHTISVKAILPGLRSDVKIETSVILGHIAKQGPHNTFITPSVPVLPSAPPYFSGGQGAPIYNSPGGEFPTVHKSSKDESYNTVYDGASGSNSSSPRQAPPPYNEVIKQ